MRPELAVLAVAATALASCQHSQDRSFERQIEIEELHGIWEMNAQTIEDLRSLGREEPIAQDEHFIEIRPDFTCLFHTFDPGWIPIGGSLDSENTTCTWQYSSGAEQEITLRSSTGTRNRISYRIGETDDGSLILWQYIADPDLWRYCEYEKIE